MIYSAALRNARWKAGTALGVLLPLLAVPAQADDQPTARDIVVTAAGFEQKITDAPGSISVVTEEEIRQRPYMTLIDAVRDLEGVDVGETTDKTGQRTISLRGMGSEYTLILIDGKRQNNHGDIYPNSFGGNQFNHIPPLDAIERIEVIRGPASTLYGADALGGVINIITKKVTSRWTGSVTASRSLQEVSDFGDDITFDFSANGPIVPGLLGIGLRGSIYERMSSRPTFEPAVDPNGNVFVRSLGFGGGGRTVDNTNKAAGFTLNLTPAMNHSFSFDFDISRQEYDNTPNTDPQTGAVSFPLGTVDSLTTIWRAGGNGVVAPQVGYTSEQKFNRMNWALTHEGDWGFGRSFVSLAYVETDNKGRTMPFSVAERLELQELWGAACTALGRAERCSGAANNNAGYTPPAYTVLDPTDRARLDALLPRPIRTLESNQYTLDARLDIPVDDMFGSHRFIIGGQYIDGELDDGVFGLEGSIEGIQSFQKHKMWSLFAEDNWSPIDILTITGGLRYDKHDVFGGRLSPRLYAVLNVMPELTVKGGVSTGYKTPKSTDLYPGITGFGGQGTSPWTGNPDLKPETSVNTEIAVYWNPTPRSGLNITAFQNDFKDKIESQTITERCSDNGNVRPCADLGDYWEVLGIGSLNQPVNVDRARIRGIEAAGRLEVIEDLNLRANYTLTDSKRRSGNPNLMGYPLTNAARHMANGTIDWTPIEPLSVQLMAEVRSKRFGGWNTNLARPNWYKGYQVLHLGAQWRVNDNITIGGRVNNLLDKDFTAYDVDFTEVNGAWQPQYTDHYNNKDKARSYWVSLNARF